MDVTRKKLAVLALSLAVALVTGCSTQQEPVGGAGAGPAGQCRNAQQAQARYQAAWSTARAELGIPELAAVDEQVCEVDTSRYAKAPKSGNAYRIAFAAQGPTNSWGLTSEEAFKRHAAGLGVQTLYASANGDAATQVDNIAQLSSQNPDAMVVVPMGDAITGQVQAAAQQGVPVVLCSGRLGPGSGAVSTVTRQYELLGGMYAEWLAHTLGGHGKVAMLSGLAGVPTAEYQRAAAKKVFAKYPGISVVTEQYTQWSPTVAKTVAANLLTQYPDLNGIWSDSGYGDMGVVQAYRDAGKPVPPLTGDAVNGFLKAVQGTDVRFAVSSFPPEQSIQCLDTAMAILKGQPVLDKIYIDSPSFTNEQLAQYVRRECGDNLLVPSSLPIDQLRELKLC
ncbi:MAG: substrate-binding domain-containing protein [Pseudonocardia sp.]|nr:substrate-binding domain-containing protein [Pseudonocardia sp.]